ncbi:MAG: hypothetical protein KJ893_02740 [Candidatus Omnitrophica bacterium]|nr:hypothetical protein [Candidatus Omnitrophota bacterium]MBU4478668.1 hypothetical protein [Candidatus Omnitrophota bacterium]
MKKKVLLKITVLIVINLFLISGKCYSQFFEMKSVDFTTLCPSVSVDTLLFRDAFVKACYFKRNDNELLERNLVKLLSERISTLIEERSLKEAYLEYQRLSRMGMEIEQSVKNKLLVALKEKSEEYVIAQRYKEALIFYQMLIEISSEEEKSVLYFYIGGVKALQGDFRKALIYMKKACEKSLNNLIFKFACLSLEEIMFSEEICDMLRPLQPQESRPWEIEFIQKYTKYIRLQQNIREILNNEFEEKMADCLQRNEAGYVICAGIEEYLIRERLIFRNTFFKMGVFSEDAENSRLSVGIKPGTGLAKIIEFKYPQLFAEWMDKELQNCMRLLFKNLAIPQWCIQIEKEYHLKRKIGKAQKALNRQAVIL